MNVRQLIEELKEFPDDMPIEVFAEYDAGFAWAGGDIDEVREQHNWDGKKVVGIISYEKPL